MRIRSIKPEFWTSTSISNLEIEDRLLFVGIWSYVDDNGVGLDRLSLIATDLFPDDIERDPRETFARVSRGLANLSEGGRIVRYTIDGRDYLAVVNWAEHQRIDKPAKARYPAPTTPNAVIRDTLATPSRDPRDWNRGTGEQGNRGTGDPSLRDGGATDDGENLPAVIDASSAPAKADPPTKPSRGSRLTDDWQPSRSPGNLAAEEGHTPEWLTDQLQRFRNHWIAKAGADATKLDWDRTWQNWIKKAVDYAPRKQPKTGATLDASDWDHMMAAAKARDEKRIA